MLVGGCVRDALTGRESADIDCEVYGLAPQALRSLAAEFGEVDESGARYGIFSLKGAGIDLAVPRLERRTGPKHGDFDVRLDPALPFARAAARRDFTVNAILRDALTGEIVDPFGGQADLRRGVLRAVPGGRALPKIRSACCGARSLRRGFACRRMQRRLKRCGR